jgi:hypothetical protein
MGALDVTVIANLFGDVPDATGTNSEKKPPANGLHGWAKEDCVTEWF